LRYYEDFEIGDVIETRRRTITEADIVNFCGFSGDWFPLHSDVEYAEKSVFGERIAHGMLVMSVATGLLPLNDIAIVAFYGMDKVRFRAPTKIGDTLRLQVNITGKEDKGEMGGLVTFDMYVKNQKNEDAAVSIMKVMVAKNNGA
jgi:3-hydroxybutyryl-CoA dehydratase